MPPAYTYYYSNHTDTAALALPLHAPPSSGARWQVVFKRAGYCMRPYPYFVLLFVSFSFIPILFTLVREDARH